MTLVNFPSGLGLKVTIEYYLDSLNEKEKLKLKLTSKNLSYTMILPALTFMGNQFNKKTTKKGLMMHGMLDENTHTFLENFKILKTYKL